MIRKKSLKDRNTIDLTGPQGNAYVLLGYAQKLAFELDLDADAICEEMRSGDYENLVQVFDKHFGKFITLLR